MAMVLYDRPDQSGMTSHLSDLSGADLVQLLRRNISLILLITALGVALTGVWLSRQAPIYLSSASIVLRGSELPSDTMTAPQSRGSVEPTQVFTEVEVMSSRDFVRDLADALGLFADPRYNPALVTEAPQHPLNLLLETERRFADTGLVLTALRILNPDDPRLLSVAEQQDAAVNKLMGQYAVSASDRHNVVKIDARTPDPNLSAEIANAAATLYIGSRSSVQQRDADRLIAFLDQRREEIAEKLASTQAEAASLIRDFDLNNTTEVDLLVAENVRLGNRLAVADPGSATETQIKTRMAEIDTVLDARVRAEIKLAELNLALETETSRFDSVHQRLDELRAQKQTPNHDVAQIARAEVPQQPVGPAIGATMAVAGLSFFLIGAVVAILHENIDRRVTSQSDAEGASGLDVIGSLPQLSNRVVRRNGGVAGVIRSEADSSFTNGISDLVTLCMRDAPERGAPVVLIGSALSGEGKSSVVTSIGVSAATDDLRVLLIDFDVHRMGATRQLKARTGRGTMTDMLQGEKPVSAYIKHTDIAGLDLMNFKPGSRVSRRVLKTQALLDVFDGLRADYDLILIDTPPFLASEEAGRLARVVDKAILVAGWRMTTQEAIGTTVQRMRRSGLSIAGIVINQIAPRKAMAYGYHTYSADYYGDSHA